MFDKKLKLIALFLLLVFLVLLIHLVQEGGPPPPQLLRVRGLAAAGPGRCGGQAAAAAAAAVRARIVPIGYRITFKNHSRLLLLSEKIIEIRSSPPSLCPGDI